MVDTARYIRIPYADRGRSFDGCDCYGFVLLFYQEEYGVEIEDVMYESAQNHAANARLIDVSKETIRAREVETPAEGDIVLMRAMGHPAHVGVYIEPRSCLHISRRYGTVCEPLSRCKMQIEGYYRVNR
jgi:cell wall-associated NlpC family hydrolase